MNQWVIPHAHTKAQIKPLFLSPELAEVHQKPHNKCTHKCPAQERSRMNALAYDSFIVNIYSSVIPVQRWLGPCKNKTVVSKLSSVESVTCAWAGTPSSVRAAPLLLLQGRGSCAKARTWCAIRASRRGKQSTVRLYWINSNIKRCFCRGRNRM